eukprot:UN3381
MRLNPCLFFGYFPCRLSSFTGFRISVGLLVDLAFFLSLALPWFACISPSLSSCFWFWGSWRFRGLFLLSVRVSFVRYLFFRCSGSPCIYRFCGCGWLFARLFEGGPGVSDAVLPWSLCVLSWTGAFRAPHFVGGSSLSGCAGGLSLCALGLRLFFPLFFFGSVR